jgi:methionyl-tRNA formyltransferase
MNDPLKIVFMGTAPLARDILGALLDCDRFRIVGVVSQPDRPAGRKMRLQPTPVKELALQHGIEVYQPEKIRSDESVAKLQEWEADLGVVAAYGQILPEKILTIPRHGCLNVHTSILPEYRGAAPIQWAIYDRIPETGVTVMKMDKGMDTGDIIAIRKTPIDPEESSAQLHDRLAVIGGQLLVETIPGYIDGTIQPVPQDHSLATHARKIEKADSLIDWSRTPEQIRAQILAFTPWPGASSAILPDNPENGSLPFKIWKIKPLGLIPDDQASTAVPGTILEADPHQVIVACGDGRLAALEELQFPGGRRLPITAIQAAGTFRRGMMLGNG